jgi:hypothetical protein
MPACLDGLSASAPFAHYRRQLMQTIPPSYRA